EVPGDGLGAVAGGPVAGASPGVDAARRVEVARAAPVAGDPDRGFGEQVQPLLGGEVHRPAAADGLAVAHLEVAVGEDAPGDPQVGREVAAHVDGLAVAPVAGTADPG